MEKLDVIIYGCGVMGRRTAAALLEKQGFRITGAVDEASDLIGRDLGSLLEPQSPLGIPVRDDPEALFQETGARAVVLTTRSHLREVQPQIQQCVEAGLNVISTCEELSFPWQREPDLARGIDALAKEHGVSVVGTGINPGFLMDTLPLCLTAPCLRVDRIEVTRMMNSAKRRLPFQKKVGTGLSPETFREHIAQGVITGHVGLLESMHMIAAALGWPLEDARELPPEPVIAMEETQSGLGTVPAGKVIGLMSVAHGRMDGRRVITLTFRASADVQEEYDEIIIEGLPGIHQKIEGGVHGDIGTVAVTINTIPVAVEARPGLLTMKDLPPAAATR